MDEKEGDDSFQLLCVSTDTRPYYILSLLQERELLRAKVQAGTATDIQSAAASTMAAALIEEVLDGLEKIT